jgi:opacity protein-like surface antigen
MSSGNQRIKISIVAVLAWTAFTCTAYAQAPAPASGGQSSRGYVEGVAQSAFGNVTSQSFGVELGVTIVPAVQVFVDVGLARDTAPGSLGAAAQVVAGFLSQTQSNVTFRGKQPVTFGLAGVRFPFATSSKIEPYVMAGGGMAQVKKDVSFSVNGSDVTNTIEQLGVVLGTDLSGSETRPMVTFGVGVVWPAWQRLIIDFQYRYGRVFTEDEGLNLSRAGIGIGVRF